MCVVSFPSTVQMVYTILLPLSSLDVIPQEISSDLIFSFSVDQDYAYNQRLEDLGFETHFMILNVGSMFYYITFGLIILLISLINKFCGRKKFKISAKLK